MGAKFYTIILVTAPLSCIAFPYRFRCQRIELRTRVRKLYGEVSSGIDSTNAFNTLPRIFVGDLSHPRKREGSSLKVGSTVLLSKDQSFYMTKVMRIFSKGKKSKTALDHLLPGLTNEDSTLDLSRCIRIFDGINGEWLCQLNEPNSTDDSKRASHRKMKQLNDFPLEAKCILQIREQDTSQRCTKYPWLFFAPIKKQKAKLLVEKCTELGVARFYPVMTDHTDHASAVACIGENNANENKFDDPLSVLYSALDSRRDGSKDVDKLSIVALEAAEQSEQLNVPEFVSLGRNDSDLDCDVQYLLQYWVSTHGKDKVLLICRERTEDCQNVLPLLKAFEKFPDKSIAFLIGPEGGWSRLEEDLFDAFSWTNPESIIGISLGSNILRAETAGITAIAGYNLWQSASRMQMEM